MIQPGNRSDRGPDLQRECPQDQLPIGWVVKLFCLLLVAIAVFGVFRVYFERFFPSISFYVLAIAPSAWFSRWAAKRFAAERHDDSPFCRGAHKTPSMVAGVSAFVCGYAVLVFVLGTELTERIGARHVVKASVVGNVEQRGKRGRSLGYGCRISNIDFGGRRYRVRQCSAANGFQIVGARPIPCVIKRSVFGALTYCSSGCEPPRVLRRLQLLRG